MLAVAGLTEAVNTAGGEAVIRQRCSSALQAAKRASKARTKIPARRRSGIRHGARTAAPRRSSIRLAQALELIPLIEKLTRTVTASTAQQSFERNAARRRRRKQLAERAQAQAHLIEDELTASSTIRTERNKNRSHLKAQAVFAL